MNQLQGNIDNRTVHPAHAAVSTSPGLNRSGNSNWGIVDVPFQMSSKLCDSTTTDYSVPELKQIDWDNYNYDFQFEMNIKRESELALEDEDYVWQGYGS